MGANVMRAVGLMSGTSMDAIDAALLETDGRAHVRVLGHGARAYEAEERDLLRRAMDAARSLSRRYGRPPPLARAEAMLTRAHGEAVRRLLAETGADRASIHVVGFHGQTVLHRPEEHLTIQLGDGPALADALGLPVMYDFRAADIEAGGEGAPLVPVYHRALARASDLPRPLAVVNIGGVANVTWVGMGEDDLLAFDTGPGNALIDDWVRARAGLAMDADGRLARAGRVDAAALAALLAAPFFDRPPPKSLDRGAFPLTPVASLGLEDGAATLTAFTAAAIARAEAHMPERPRLWVVSGGGARNPALMAALEARLGAPVRDANALGWSADFMEAEAFAYLAVRARRGLPITFPGTTGAPRPLGAGRLALPPSGG